MRDIRVDRWADVLVNYALQARSGQKAVIVGEFEALPLIEAAYEKFVQKGVVTDVVMAPVLGDWGRV